MIGARVDIKMLTRIAWLVVLLHLIIATVHGFAHRQLGITLDAFQSAYVLVVITVAPIFGGVLLWARRVRSGFAVLALSLTGSVVFGVYWHYLAQSPDNVLHLHEGALQSLFSLTAALLVVSEVSGVVVGLWGMKRSNDRDPDN